MGPTRPADKKVKYGHQQMQGNEQPGIWDRLSQLLGPAPAQAEKTYQPFSPEHTAASRAELQRYFTTGK